MIKERFKMGIKRKLIALVMSVILLHGTTVYAEPLSQQLQEQQKQLQENREIYNSLEAEKEAIELKIQNYDAQIEELMIKIEENKEKIKKTEGQIAHIEKEVKVLEQKIEKEKALMDRRLSSLYKKGKSQYLSLILSAEGLGDLISKMDSIKRVSDYDKAFIDSYQRKVNRLNKASAELVETKRRLAELKRSDEERISVISNSIKEQKKLIEELEAKQAIYASRITESQKLVNETLAQMEQMNGSTSRPTAQRPISRGGASVSNNEVLAYASRFLGTPYRWGGTSPDTGFDCSGFTQYVYAHFGIRIGRTTRDQIKSGVAVSRSELQVGDLVLFGRNGDPTHVGIYAGNNTYIHSPRTGDVVKISAMTRNDFIIGRRVR